VLPYPEVKIFVLDNGAPYRSAAGRIGKSFDVTKTRTMWIESRIESKNPFRHITANSFKVARSKGSVRPKCPKQFRFRNYNYLSR